MAHERGGMMRVEFGWFLDRAPWAFSSPGLNAVRVGRQGLVQLLQTRLGTTRPPVPHIVRVNQYLARLQEINRPGAWFHDSFSVDPWSTAQELLSARDDLVANGWNGRLPEGEVSDLLASVAELEQVGLPLAPSLADDIADLLPSLESALPLGIDVVELQHPRQTFPRVWRQILDRLEERGVEVCEPGVQTEPSPSITVLEAETEWEAAEHAARWLAAAPSGTSTVVAASAPTTILDQYLAGHGLPRLGVGGKSPWRAQDQIIPLFMEVVWGPVNVRLLAEFLSLPISPVRRGAAYRLLKALSAEPGTGGPAWNDALERISTDPRLGPDMAEELDRLFSRDLLSEQDGVSGALLVERSSWLAGRLAALAVRDESLKGTAAQLQTLVTLVANLPRVSRADLRRMISSVVTESANPLTTAEASPWLRLNHLNELMDNVDDVIWWGFQQATAAPERRWSAGDTAALAAAGVELPSPESLAALNVAQTLRAASRCRNLLLVQTTQQDGERAEGNPLLEALVAAQTSDRKRDGDLPGIAYRVKSCKVRADAISGVGSWSLAGRSTRLVPAAALKTSVPASSFDLGPRPDLLPETLSFSQLERLLGCSLAWVLDRKIGLKVADADSVPEGNRMIGTFTHKVVEELQADLAAANQAVPTRDRIAAKIDQLLPRLASELLLPGQGSRLMHLRTVVEASVLTFFTTLSAAGIVIQQMEQGFTKDLALNAAGQEMRIPVKGAADVVGIDGEGRRVVIDLKWNNRSKYKLAEVRDGKALQLALYQWALNDDGAAAFDSPAAFYLLKQQTFASTDPAFGNALTSRQPPEVLWDQARKAAEFSIDEVLNGRVAASARALEELLDTDESSAEALAEAEGRYYAKPPCTFCNFSALCGLKGDLS